MEYTIRSFERAIEDCPGRETPCARVSLRYPEVTAAAGDGVRTKLNELILTPMLQSMDIEGSRESPEALAEELFFYYNRTLKDFPDYTAQWYVERSADVVFDSLGILSLLYTDQMYTGGAHPMRQELFRMFDTRTGDPFRLDSMLVEGGKQELAALAEREFRRVRELPREKTLNEAGFWFQGNRFALNDNLGLTSRGLELIFNPYEIAPYATGSTRLVLPYDSVSAVLDLGRRLR